MKIRGVHLSEFIAAFERLLPQPSVTILEKTFSRWSDREFTGAGPTHTRRLSCDDWSIQVEIIEGGMQPDLANVKRVLFSGDEDAFMRDMIAMKIALA